MSRPGFVRINRDRINGVLYNLLINGIYWGYNLLILTCDPNFQRDIQVVLSQKKKWEGEWKQPKNTKRVTWEERNRNLDRDFAQVGWYLLFGMLRPEIFRKMIFLIFDADFCSKVETAT